MKQWIAAFAVLLAPVGTVQAQQVQTIQDRHITGWGWRSCRTMIALNELRQETPQMQWALGFISGAAVMARQVASNNNRPSRFVQRLENTPEERLVERIRRHCTSNRELRLYQAADRVMGDLQRE